ncbi:CCZ1 [Candida jiufengensis]|uniref:CCZ1 n=1 Tax=Candida jiufengensis TaxID=497108 RepID=UPI0022253037|nr:CCZ1 [Candida jiufengensis]KAI5957010.1 CCZ1 [Candida jiufengensis]
MASYITQYFPHISSLSLSLNDDISKESINPLIRNKLNYILIVDFKNDDNLKEFEENDSSDDILAYVQEDPSNNNEINSKEYQSIGIIKGISAFIHGFGAKSNESQQDPMILKLSNETIISYKIELEYTIICSINSNDDKVIKQLEYLIKQQYCFFKLINKSIEANIKLGVDVVKKLLDEWWSKFLKSFNSQEYSEDIDWPNKLNYLGFNSIHLPIRYRKSSINISNRLKEEFKKLLQNEELIPLSVLISCFSKSPKKLGHISSQSIDEKINDESLIDIYNLMENDFIMQQYTHDNIEIPQLDDSSGPLSLLNPINITNNLVVQPWNSVSGIIRGDNTAQETTSDENDKKVGFGWLSMPSFLSKSSVEINNNSIPVPQEHANNGQFLYGIQEDESIRRKIVYLPIKKDDDVVEEEFQLITFVKDDIYITLIYSSIDTNKLDDPNFYHQLTNNVLIPMLDDIEQEVLNSTMSKSINSIKTINISSNIDSDFLYTIFDLKNKTYTSSIPLILTNLSQSKNNQIIINIHNQLIEILTGLDLNIHEFYHKFKSNQNNDWMFYFIKFKNKLIIILKNKNKFVSSIGNNGNDLLVEESVINQITGVVSDYASLGFLDNLGNDVKYWLGQVIDTE